MYIQQLMSCIYVGWLLAGSEWSPSCCIYVKLPPDDEKQTCSKHVEANYRNQLRVK
jgi:hypothetical protein